ncbi:HAD family hydrolase, partial [Lacticaseibacillus rhamnosus]
MRRPASSYGGATSFRRAARRATRPGRRTPTPGRSAAARRSVPIVEQFAGKIAERLAESSKHKRLPRVEREPEVPAACLERADVAEVLEKVGLGRYIDALVTSRDFGRAKPDPAIYREGARRLGVRLERTCM